MNHLATVLFVDDEEKVLQGFQRMLRNSPFRVITATSGQEGLRKIEQDPVDIVVSDYKMPEMTGTEFVSQVHRLHPEIVRIILTGHAELDMTIDSINKGHVFLFLRKPCCSAELTHALYQSIYRRQLLQKSRQMIAALEVQAGFLESLEAIEPGFTDVKKDSDGNVIIRPDPVDIRTLIAEAEAELDTATCNNKKK
jgi:DNA-binding NtrC family response regulator